MAVNSLSLEQVKDLFVFISSHMIESKDMLTHADQAIGDGDHGIGMARGFEAVAEKLDSGDFSSVADIFRSVGFTLLASIGGASGAIFGSFFIGASNGLKDCSELDSPAFARCLQAGLEMVKIRGKAKVGDKTMVDALEPAAQAAQANKEKSLDEITLLTSQAAESGKENTKNLIATTGKAKTLGERSLGHPDPGAISMSLILRFTHEHIQGLSNEM